MVKFGRRLLSEKNDVWAEHYIDYKVRAALRFSIEQIYMLTYI